MEKQPKMAKGFHDPSNVLDTFANEILVVVNDPTGVHITLGSRRFDGTIEPPQLKKVVVSRLVLPHDTATALIDRLTQMKEAIALQAEKAQSGKTTH